MKNLLKLLLISLSVSTLNIYSVSAQRPSGPSRFHVLSVTAPAHTATFDCSNPAAYHTDQDGSYQCGYTNQGSVPNGGPPTASNGSTYSGSPQNYDCYYYATNPTATSFYNSNTDTRTYPVNCKTYSASAVGAPINSALLILIAAGVVIGAIMVNRMNTKTKSVN